MSWYNPLSWGNTGDTTPLTTEQANADAQAKALQAQRAALGGNSYQVDTTQSGADRAMQLQNIKALQDAATGRVASPAELQLRQQAANNNAAAFGAAAALKGRTPGASFTTASRQNAANDLDTNATAAAMRASETANARTALTGAVATQEQQDQQGAQTAAALKSSYDQSLLSGGLASQGQGVTAAGGTVKANTDNAATQNSFAGGLIGGAASGLEKLAMTSDRNEKDDVSTPGSADLDKTFLALGGGKTFDYKHPGQDGEEAGHRVGVMAQDLKQSKLGKETVIDGKPLKVDRDNAIGLALAGLSAMTKRIRALEGKT